MKKSYTMIGAVACSLFMTAVAATPAVRQTSTGKVEMNKLTKIESMPMAVDTQAPMRAAGFTKLDDLVGDWDVNYNSLLDGQSGPQTRTYTVAIKDAAKGEVSVSGIINVSGLKDFVAVVDLEKGTFSISNKQLLGKDSDGDVMLYFKDVSDEGKLMAGASSMDALVGTISGNTITFPELAVWALGDPTNENAGWYLLGHAFSMTCAVSQGDPNEGWKDLCNAEFIDGWIMPGTGNDPEKYPWTVKVQQNVENPKLLRLDNPYAASGSPLKQAAETNGGYVVISLEDVDFVQVEDKIYTGVKNGTDKICATNIEGFYVGQGFSAAQIKEQLGNQIPAWSTYKDKVISIPTCRFSTGDGKMYSWQSQNGASLVDKMQTKLVLEKDPFDTNSVEMIGTEENAPVEYFTLQGMRVVNPEKGQILVKRQGSKVSKVVVR